MDETKLNKRPALTSRQRDVLTVIRQHMENHGVPPTRAEIAQALQFRSVNAAEDHLKALARKGVIRLNPGTSRGIQLLGIHGIGLPVVSCLSTHLPLLSEQHIDSCLPVDRRLFSSAPSFMFRMPDHSLQNAGILMHDLLAIATLPDYTHHPLLLVRMNHQDICLKRVTYLNSNHVQLDSAHPDFGSITMDLAHQPLTIEGACVGVLRNGSTVSA